MAGDSNENKIPTKFGAPSFIARMKALCSCGWAWNLMEHSKPNLQTFDSQIPDSSYSLSIPSEPPDLGNWFASYLYESPVLISNSFHNEVDTHENEREKEEGNLGGFRENGNKVEVFVHKKQNSNGVVKCGSTSGNEYGNQCLSKISGSSESPSSLSEPTNIKNWFSSYVYESPSLDTTDGFGDSLYKESKCEKDGFLVENSKRQNEEDLGSSSRISSVSEEVVGEKEQSVGLAKCDSSWRDTKQARQPFSEAPGPLESPLLLSEPIDIRNWYSSYLYESPSLDTPDDFGDSVCKESKCEEDGFMIENSKRDNEEDLGDFSEKRSVSEEVVGEEEQPKELAKCDSSWRDTKQERQPLSKVPGPLESSSLLSEPTDIRNWFSSYVYESPSLDTANGFGDSVCKDGKAEKDEVLVEDSNREKEEDLEDFSTSRSDSEEVGVEKVQSEEFAKYNTSRHNKQEQPVSEIGPNTGVDENLSCQNGLCVEYTPKALQNHGISQAKDGDTSSFNKGGSHGKLNQEIFHVTRFKPSKNQRCPCSDGASFHAEVTVHVADCLQLKSDSVLISVNGASVSKSTHGSKEIKDDGKGISENGFVTTRKRKFTAKNDENSPKGPQESSKETVPLVSGKKAVVRRKALADATNFHHSPAMMITGKWKCPQKRKPNVGPPLKQLGLEQWIRKM